MDSTTDQPTSAAIGAVIDADGHVLEPPSAFRMLPDAFRPRIERDAAGFEHVLVGDQEILMVSLGLLGSPGSRMSDLDAMKPYEEAQPGGFDPNIRLVDMDDEGIDVAVLYPTLGLNFWAIRDPAAAVAVARAYNDWLGSYCAADPARLVGAAMVPLQDPAAAVAELRRAHDELGFAAAFVRPNPCLGRCLADDAHEIVWETAAELDMTIGIHEGSSVLIQTLGSDRLFSPFTLHAVSHAFEQMLACAELIAFGVMERYPNLRFAFLESGGGWAPYWTWRLDEQVHGFGNFHRDMKLLPSEYFARQCWISFEIDEPALPVLTPVIGEDKVIWGSDYPHHDATFPGAVKELRETIAPLPAAVQAKVLGSNAAQMYRLPTPA